MPGLLRALDRRRVPDPVSVAVREPTLDDVFPVLTGQAASPALASRVPAGRGGERG